MDFFQHRYYKLNKILLTSIGQWPYHSTRANVGFASVILFLAAGQIIPQILAIMKYREDWNILLECISPLIFDIGCFAKFFTSIWNWQKMLKLLDRIRTDWQVLALDPEVNILHEYAEWGRKITTIYTVSVFSTGFLFVIQPVMPKIIDILLRNGSDPGEFPVPVDYYNLDAQKYYFYIILYTYICINAGLLVTLATDSILIVYVQHGCGIFAAVGHKLQRVARQRRTANMHMDFEYLVSCIGRHNDAIEYAQLIEAAYSVCFFIIVGCNMVIISVTGLQIITKTNDPEEIIRFVAFIFGQMVHLYVKCHMAQILMDHSISIRYYIGNSNWYRLSLESQKLLNLMMIRCNMPCKLTAGKIADMSVETFGVVLKTSASYFTLLRSM